jgi:hypothetical protein
LRKLHGGEVVVVDGNVVSDGRVEINVEKSVVRVVTMNKNKLLFKCY